MVINKKVLLEQEYNKQLKRIKQFIRRATKRGYIFEENIIPKKPKKITQASVNRLKNITPAKLYQKSKAFSPFENKVVKGTEVRKQERKASAKKAAQTRLNRIRNKFYNDYKESGYKKGKIEKKDTSQTFATLEGIREEIRKWTPSTIWTSGLTEAKQRDKNILENILNGAISQEGEETVGKRLEENSMEANTLVQEILYGSGDREGNFKDGRTQVNFDLARFSAIIMGRPLTVDESKDLAEIAENLEVIN